MTPQWPSGSLRLYSGLSVSRVRCGMVSVVCIIMLSLHLMDHSRDFLTFPMLTVCQHTVRVCIQWGFQVSYISSHFRVHASVWFVLAIYVLKGS